LIEQLLAILTNPNIVFLLLTIGVQAIIIELSSPGGWVAGFIGAVCLALAAYGLGVLSVNWFGLVFLAIAFTLFILDIKAPTHGALTRRACIPDRGLPGAVQLAIQPFLPARFGAPGHRDIHLHRGNLLRFPAFCGARPKEPNTDRCGKHPGEGGNRAGCTGACRNRAARGRIVDSPGNRR